MKVGDSVYCIKENSGHSIGRTYVVRNLFDNEVELNVDKGTKNELTGNLVTGRAYYLDIPMYDYSYFYDYFVDIKKHRKLKLDRINEKFYSKG